MQDAGDGRHQTVADRGPVSGLEIGVGNTVVAYRGELPDFASLVKKIATDPQFRNKIGIDMEKMRLAMEIEKERLALVPLDECLRKLALQDDAVLKFGGPL